MKETEYTKIKINTADRPEWLKARRIGIGGSDAAAVLGMNPYKTAEQLLEEKLADAPDDTPPSLACRHGIHCESFVAELFMEATGLNVRKSNYIYRSARYPFMLANIDRAVSDPAVRHKHTGTMLHVGGLECKTTSAYNKNKFGESGAVVKDGDEGDLPFPMEYYIQATHYMAVTGWEKWYVAALIGNADFRWYKVERDEKNIRYLIEEEQKFIERINNEKKARGIKYA